MAASLTSPLPRETMATSVTPFMARIFGTRRAISFDDILVRITIRSSISVEQSLALKPDKASEGRGGEQPLDDIHVGKHSHQASNLARMRQDNRLKLATDGSVAYPRSIALSSLGKRRRPAPLRVPKATAATSIHSKCACRPYLTRH